MPAAPDRRLTDPRRLGGAYTVRPHWEQVDTILGRESAHRLNRDRIRAGQPQPAEPQGLWGDILNPTRLRVAVEVTVGVGLLVAVFLVVLLLSL